MLSVLNSQMADKQGYYQNARAEEADPGKYNYIYFTNTTEKLTSVIAPFTMHACSMTRIRKKVYTSNVTPSVLNQLMVSLSYVTVGCIM